MKYLQSDATKYLSERILNMVNDIQDKTIRFIF